MREDLTQMHYIQRAAKISSLNLVKLDGNIAVVANGGGLALASLDVIASVGGKCGAMVEYPND